MTSIWNDELLDALRMVGDPRLDDPVPRSRSTRPAWYSIDVHPVDEERVRPGPPEPIRLLQTWRLRELGALPVLPKADDPFWAELDPPSADDRLAVAVRDLFVLHGGEICAALLLSSLPHSYAASAGAEVLSYTTELQSKARRRIAETAQLVVEVMMGDETCQYVVKEPPEPGESQSLRAGGLAFARVLTTRLTHGIIREQVMLTGTWDPDDRLEMPRHDGVYGPLIAKGVPINQEELLGTLSTFTISVLDVLDKLGVEWPEKAQQGYIDLWDRVGALLGIGTPEVVAKLPKTVRDKLPLEYQERLRPRTVQEFRELTELIRDRCWPRSQPGFQLDPFAGIYGKRLTRSLLDELQSAMPRGMERMPIMLMRYLVHEDAEELLGLGGGGLMEAVLNVPRWMQNPLWPTRKGMAQMGMERMVRMSATEVSRRAFVYFLQTKDDAPFRFPGLEAKDFQISTGRSAR